MPGSVLSHILVLGFLFLGVGGNADDSVELVQLYRDLHSHPEISFKETNTAARFAKELSLAGCEVTEKVGGTGVVGLMKNGPGPVILVRAELDALPLQEKTGLPYESVNPGIMHACGHDLHLAVSIGVARRMNRERADWRGTLIFIGQPAEEKNSGARAMLKAGLFTRFPKPKYAIALHSSSHLASGKLGYASGPALAGSTPVDITIYGKSGHGAMPQDTIDPIVLASLFVVDLQSIVSREVAPGEPAVVTVGSIHGGTKHNIIPDSVSLQLTVRAFRDNTRDTILAALQRRAEGLSLAHGAPKPTVRIGHSSLALVNDPDVVAKVLPAFRTVVGPSNVIKISPSMASEDFGEFAKAGAPVFQFALGTIDPARLKAMKEKEIPALHSSHYFPDPTSSMEVGIQSMREALRALLAETP